MSAPQPIPQDDDGVHALPPLPPVAAAEAAARLDRTPSDADEAPAVDAPAPAAPRPRRPPAKRAPRARKPKVATPPRPEIAPEIAAARFEAAAADRSVIVPADSDTAPTVEEPAADAEEPAAEEHVPVPDAVESQADVAEPARPHSEPETEVAESAVEPEPESAEPAETETAAETVEPEPEPEAESEADAAEPEPEVVEAEAEAVEPEAEAVEPEPEPEPDAVEPEPLAEVEPEAVEAESEADAADLEPDLAPASEPEREDDPAEVPEPSVAEVFGDLADEVFVVASEEAVSEAAASPTPAVHVRGVTKSFGATVAVDAIDLRIPAGTFYGIVGPNGAGKTTTLSMIAGLLRPDSGDIAIAGIDLAADPRRAKQQMGILPDRLRTFDRLTGRQLLHYYGVLRGLRSAVVESRSAELARAFDLTDALARPVSDYSAGMTKKIMLAGAMIHSPRVLVLDEPFESVDPVSSAVVLDILSAYVAHGGTVVLSSHGMELVERVCSGLAVIVGGRVLAEGTVDEVRGDLTLEERFIELSGGISDAEGLEWLHTFSD
ncbi:ABC transporter ATP-binding protein [Microbacterium hominis]|uniref:ABC transporter ATP-binding protein n=1 Tax=Microbacterium hominis TaxID=162426 RepID=UPI001F057E9A|nr:ABC transporter ATP-binding protein [Microbacterium hominis]